MLEALDCALERLKPADRDILLQRFYDEMPVATIAQSLEITAEATQKRIERALDRLRARLPSAPQRSAETVAGGLTQFASQLPPIGMATAILARMPAASKASAAAKITGMTVGQKTAIGLALTALLATELWQFARFDRLRDEAASSRRAVDGVEQELGRVREELRMARQLQDRARKEHLELLSLRGRVQQLRAELLRTQQASRSSSGQTPPAPAQDSILFSLALTNQIPPGQSLIAGGWRTLGTRRYLLVTPERQKDATDNEFIVTKPQVIAAPETFWNEIGWGEARSDAHHSAVAGLMKQSEVDTLLAAAKSAPGADFSNVSRAERKEGEYLAFGFSVDDEAGTGVMLSLDVRPRLSPDDQSVTLEIQPSDFGTNAPVHPSLHSAP